MSQREFAYAAGIHRSTLSEYENGHRLPPDKTWRRMAAVLGVDPEISELADEGGVQWEIEHRGCLTRCEPYWGEDD